jgi:hypothetical protein
MRRCWRAEVVAIQVVPPHEADEFRAIVGIRRIDTGERGSERIRILAVGHCPRVIPAGGEELAVIVDALRDIVVSAERRRAGNSPAVLILLRWQRIAASRASALDAE